MKSESERAKLRTEYVLKIQSQEVMNEKIFSIVVKSCFRFFIYRLQ